MRKLLRSAILGATFIVAGAAPPFAAQPVAAAPPAPPADASIAWQFDTKG